MRVLIAYATSEGQTRRIATTIAGQVRGLGHDVRLVDIASKPSDAHPTDFDAIIIAASVHHEKHQEDIEAFVSASKNVLATKSTMFLSVSLAAAFEEGREDAERYIGSFVRNSGWKPDKSLAVAGAVRSNEYDYYHQQILQYVVLKDRKVDRLKQDHEFTDWKALADAVEAFLKGEPARSALNS
jgi:menaquinone-dependent protoporphyrinogen oxidase